MEKEFFLQKLKIISQFSGLKSRDLEEIAKVCHYKTFKRGEILFNEGDDADSVYLLIDGSVEIWKDYGGGERDILAKQNTGHIVGEMAVIDELTRSATVIADNETATFMIKRDDFIILLQKLPELSFEFMKSISMLVRKSNENFINELQERNLKLEKTNRKILQIQNELVKKERLSTVGQFSSMILHDLRNPISVIKGYSDILQMKDCTQEEVHKFASAIQKEAMNLNNLANEMLDFSRGEIRLNLSVTDLEELIDNVIVWMKRKLTDSSIVIEKNIGYSGPVLIDYDRIFRVLLNLGDNSRKALLGDGLITISTSADQNAFTISVTDDGAGMDKEQLSKIFEPFTSFSRTGGTGLGMVIVKNIVEAHKGSIKVESEVHLGTTVSIIIPVHH